MADKKRRIKIKVRFGKIAAIMIAVFAALLAVDLVLKHFEVVDGWNFTVIPNFIWVESDQRNYGAAFSFLSNTEWGKIFFIVLTFIMLAVMIFVFLILPERFVILKLALSMICAGALGNLIDRLAFGYVRDFVWVNMLFSEACCNFADFWIVFGVILALIDVLFLNEWAVLPLTRKAKAWAKELEKDDNSSAVKEVEQPPQELDPIPEEFLDKKTEENQSKDSENVQETKRDGADETQPTGDGQDSNEK